MRIVCTSRRAFGFRITFKVLLGLTFIGSTASAQTGPGGVSSGSANLLLWLDGQNVNADGTSPANGTEVITWYDRSGNGVDVTRNTNGVATKSANGVTFNNIGYLNGSDVTFPTGNDPRTVIICASSPSTTVDDVFFFYGTAANNQSYGVLKIGGTNGVRNFFYGNDMNVNGGWTPSGTLKIITCTYTPNTQLLHINNDATPDTRTPTATVNTTQGAQGLQIGGWDSFDLFSEATIAEVIFYDKVLNNAERIIVNNYLSAKYGLSLANNDVYDNDNGGSGDYDHNVAGIGRAGGSTLTNTDAWSSITRISNPRDLENNEYYIWGHDAGDLVATTAGIPTGIVERIERIWRGSETGGDGNVGNVDLTFDMTGFGPFDADDLRLLISVNNDTDFNDGTDISLSGAVHSGGNLYTFPNVSQLTNDRRFTIGVVNVPLPVQLLDFNARAEDSEVHLTWTTLTEINNDYFTIERSADGKGWEELVAVPGSGNTNTVRRYSWDDRKPLWGRSYYRLKQTDFDGTFTYSSIQSVQVNKTFQDIVVYPVPARGEVFLQYPHSENIAIKLIDRLGHEYPVVPVSGWSNGSRIDISSFKPGLYYLCVTNGRDNAYRKIIIE